MSTLKGHKVEALTFWEEITEETFSKLDLHPGEFVCSHLDDTQLQAVANLKIVSIDQIRAKCHANIYFDPEEIITEIKRLIAWNQVYRTKTHSGFLYLSNLYEAIISIINKRKFHKRFLTLKIKDFQRLLTYENKFKTETEHWPVIPKNFRQYQNILHYQPTPENRKWKINQRLQSLKEPVECPKDCVCVSDCLLDSQSFCKYTLKDGWQSDCPNRANKIECRHQDPLLRDKCRNSEIQKHQRKRCKQNPEDCYSQQDIEQCLMWGIDLYTRNIVYHSLPEADISFLKAQDNKNQRNSFIQEVLLKAINSNGNQGYDFEKACLRIIGTAADHSLSPQKQNICQGNSQRHFNWRPLHLESLNTTDCQQKIDAGQIIFSAKHIYYAEILLRNFRFCNDKTAFRIHTKGKGARCIKQQGIQQGSFIVEYFGELYEPWRWYEREDFIKEVMKKRKLKNFIPEFYNIFLETHKDDPDGYDLMVVDPIKKGNFSSRFSHSCNPNCGTVATIANGKYHIGMYSFRDIKYGDELTFDYCCMTESAYQHKNSICLCGMQKCRGNYLQLANSPIFSQLVDKNTCFLSRNSLILGALSPLSESDLQLCSQHNIKGKMLNNAPEWMKKWTVQLLKSIEHQAKMYKQQLIDKWRANYPWDIDPQSNKQQKIELYSETSKQQLLSIRFQNLFTTVDKLKYFLNAIQDQRAPLCYIAEEELVKFLIEQPRVSVLHQLQEIVVGQKLEKQGQLLAKIFDFIKINNENSKIKLFYFRLGCLCVSHMLLQIKASARFNSCLVADIAYFYAFTHTYFTALEFKSHVSEEIKVSLQEVTGNPKDGRIIEKIKKRYSFQFVWGQLVSWYKQTIVSPESSLSQDRRGTLSYPMFKSTINSVYPFEKHCRKNFLKAVKDKPSSCWPSAPKNGCFLSFKNPFKCYGTIFFESVHNAELAKSLPGGNLLNICLDTINRPFQEKLNLFKKTESLFSGIGQMNQCYDILDHIESKYINFSEQLPQHVMNDITDNSGKSIKKKKAEIGSSDS